MLKFFGLLALALTASALPTPQQDARQGGWQPAVVVPAGQPVAMVPAGQPMALAPVAQPVAVIPAGQPVAVQAPVGTPSNPLVLLLSSSPFLFDPTRVSRSATSPRPHRTILPSRTLTTAHPVMSAPLPASPSPQRQSSELCSRSRRLRR